MSADWSQTLKIGDFAKVKGGKRMPLGTALTPQKSKHPYLRIVDFKDGGIDKSNLQFVPDEVFPQIARYVIGEQDLYISIVGTIGLVGAVPKELSGANLTENAAKICEIDENRVNGRYLGYFLRSELGQAAIKALTVGSTQPKLALFRIEQIEVPCPPLNEQQNIAAMLAAIDGRIVLLRETNATLEAIAQALFKSWFVDFDPVRAKMEGRAPEGMDEATVALFPDSFEESALGLVPKGWRVGQLGEEVKIAYGKNLPTSKLLDCGYPVYGGNGQIGFYDKYLYASRQVLVACRGAASGKFNQSVPRAFVTNNSLVLESDNGTLLPFGYLKGCISSADLIPFVTGSAQPQVTIENLKNFELLVPSISTLRVFEFFSSSIEDKIEENNQQAQTLATLRDTLLPRLISGSLRLPQ